MIQAPEVSVACVDPSTGAAIQDVRVLMTAATGGDLPFEDSVTITSAGTTATVTHSSHGLRSGLKVLISGANQNVYNGVYEITVTGNNSYTYTMASSGTSPATGTITSTSVIIDALTGVAGITSASPKHRYTADQPVLVTARKGSSSPFYKGGGGTFNIVETGLTSTVFLVKDE